MKTFEISKRKMKEKKRIEKIVLLMNLVLPLDDAE
jgi:hypothetical protein